MAADELPPAQKYPPIDLERFVEVALPKIQEMPILRMLGFHLESKKYEELSPLASKKSPTKFFKVIFNGKMRKVQFDLFPKAAGYFIVFISRLGGKGDDVFDVGRYFELYDKESQDKNCLDLCTFQGNLEEKVDKSLTCINRILEERFEAVLKGDEWMDVPSSFYDYK